MREDKRVTKWVTYIGVAIIAGLIIGILFRIGIAYSNKLQAETEACKLVNQREAELKQAQARYYESVTKKGEKK